MKNKRNFLHMGYPVLLLALSLFVFTGCDEKNDEEVIPGSVLLEFNLTWNGDDCAIGDVQNDHLDHPLRIDNLQMYLAPVEMRNDRGEWVEIKDVAILD